MKKMKRMLAVILSIVMVLSMAECGSDSKKEKKEEKKDQDYFTVVQDSQSMKSGKVEMEMSLKVEDSANTLKTYLGTDTVKVKAEFDDDSESETDGKMVLSVDYDGTGYKEFTDIIIKDQTTYINTKKMVSVILPLVKKYAGENVPSTLNEEMVNAMIGGDYISITEEELKTLMEQSADTVEDDTVDNGTTMLDIVTDTEKMQKYMEAYQAVAADKIAEMVKGVKPAVLGQDGENYTFTVNAENLTPFMDAFKELVKNDGEKLVAEFADKLKESVGEDDMVYKTVSDKESVKKYIDELVKGLEEQDYTSVIEAKPEFVSKVGLQGEEGSREATQDFTVKFADTESKTNVEMGISCKVTEGKAEAVSAPTESVVSVTELMNNLGALSGADTSDVDTADDADIDDVENSGL